MILVLHNIRSCYNVGAILRTCEGFGAEKVVLSGYTPRIHDANLLPHLRENLDKEIHKTALGAEEMLDIQESEDIIATVNELRADGWQVVGLENNIDSGKLYDLNDAKLSDVLGRKVVLVLGEEVNGIEPRLRDEIEVFVQIPMRGKKESFNVSVATGIALYGIMCV